jgi:hypothetical protein
MQDKNHMSYMLSDKEEDLCDVPSIDDERQESHQSSSFMKHADYYSSKGEKLLPETRSLNIKLIRDIDSAEKSRRFTEMP